MKFRKRPIIIEAEQWAPGRVVDGVREQFRLDPDGVTRSLGFGLIETLEGTMRVYAGSWVVTGVQGEKYPVREDIFVATYEPA